MIKITGNPELEKKYPEEFVNQCVCLKNRCPNCGEGFGPGIVLVCPHCGAPRPRCQNKHMTNEDTCRSHAHGRPYSLYKKLAATLSDSAIEEFIEREEYDLTQEYALAKLALSGSLDKQNLTSEELMSLVNQFFAIAAKKKKIEEGDTLTLSWSDELVNSLKKRWRQVIISLSTIVEEELKEIAATPEEAAYLTKKIMTKVRDNTKLLGNHLTSPTK